MTQEGRDLALIELEAQMIDGKLGSFFIDFHQVVYGYSEDEVRRFRFDLICKRKVRIDMLSLIRNLIL